MPVMALTSSGATNSGANLACHERSLLRPSRDSPDPIIASSASPTHSTYSGTSGSPR